MSAEEEQQQPPPPPPPTMPPALVAALLATASSSSSSCPVAAAAAATVPSWRLPGTDAASPVEVIDTHGGGAFDAAALRHRAAEYRAQPLLVRGDVALGQWPALFDRLGLAPSATRVGGCGAGEGDEEESWAPSKVYSIRVDWSRMAGQQEQEQPQGPALREEDIQAEILPDARAGLRQLLRSGGGGGGGGGDGDGDGKAATLLYAYGPLDVACLLEHREGREQGQEQGERSRRPPFDLLARLPLPACLPSNGSGSSTSTSTTTSSSSSTHPILSANLWLGANATSRIHVDAHDNLLAVAQGAKVVHLYSPFEPAALALGPPQRPPVESRLRSLLFHTAATWPRELRRVVAHVKAGEALFIPAGWSHEVFTAAAPYTAAVSLWFASADPRRVRLRPTLLHLASGGRFGAFVEAQQKVLLKRGREEDGGGEAAADGRACKNDNVK